MAASTLLIGTGVVGLTHSVLDFQGWPPAQHPQPGVATQIVPAPLQYRRDHPGEALRALERRLPPALAPPVVSVAARRPAAVPAPPVARRTQKARHRKSRSGGAPAPAPAPPTVTPTVAAPPTPAVVNTTATPSAPAAPPAATPARVSRSAISKAQARIDEKTRHAGKKANAPNGPKPGRGKDRWSVAPPAVPVPPPPGSNGSVKPHGRSGRPKTHSVFAPASPSPAAAPVRPRGPGKSPRSADAGPPPAPSPPTVAGPPADPGAVGPPAPPQAHGAQPKLEAAQPKDPGNGAGRQDQ